ncbi:MAG: NifU family protein [Phycisphaeraceae bacterium]|nr:NifU family protein [Phycisphaeraceae bacterium]
MTPAKSPTDRATSTPSPLKGQVSDILNRIRPAIQADGGDVELIDVTEAGVVQVKLHGNCIGCPSSSMTLHMGIEKTLVEKLPEVTGLEVVS